MLRVCDWLGLGQECGELGCRDSRRGRHGPCGCPQTFLQRGGPSIWALNRRGDPCCDLVSPSWEHFPGRQKGSPPLSGRLRSEPSRPR